ncbi:YfhO family protein [Luteococcus sp.]|uniref:YfhO family protein n=1 Tax=Luteococcus sp. TaxID=1969402 RepID=UPI003735B210
MTADPAVRRSRLGLAPMLAPGVLAAVLTGLLHLVVMWRSGIWPLGKSSRGLSDYGSQYLAFHQTLGRVLRGSDLVGWGFNWTAGGGVAFLPDYATYLASPLNLALVFAPPHRIEAALTILTLAKICLSAATMALLLKHLAPRAAIWPIPLLATAYASSSWVFDISIYTPMWLDGLATFPLLCLAACWTAADRHRLASIALVALSWWSNFYTAYMASLGAALFLLIWLAATSRTWLGALRAVARFAVVGIIGVLCTGVLLVPTALAVSRGVPFGLDHFDLIETSLFVATLFPLGEGVQATPAICAGSLVLVLASTLLFPRGLPVREALAWPLGVAAALLSMRLETTVWAWNIFDFPNGNPYRFSFTVVGLLVVTAWVAVQRGSLRAQTATLAWPRVESMTAAAVVVVGLLAVASGAEPIQHFSQASHYWVWPSATIVLTLVASALTHRGARAAVVTVVIVLGAGEVVASAQHIDREIRNFLGASPLFDHRASAALGRAQAATSAAQWPTHRVSGARPGGATPWTALNEPEQLGYPGLSYYSSNMPLSVATTWKGLGMTATANGRMITAAQDPAMAALAAVAIEANSVDMDDTVPRKAFPMVRLAPAPSHPVGGLAQAFSNRNLLVEEPILHPAIAGRDGRPFETPLVIAARHSADLTVSCPAGMTLQVQLAGRFAALTWQDDATGEQRQVKTDGNQIITVQPGRTTVQVKAIRPITLHPGDLACLDLAELERQVDATQVPAITASPGRMAARFATPVSGEVVLATAAQEGWSCHADDQPAPTASRAGLLTVPVENASVVECRYRTPGLTAGLLCSGLGLVMAVGFVVLPNLWRVRRR